MICINLVWSSYLANQITEFSDIVNKVNSCQSSWVKRLFDDCFHEWKIIPLYQLNKTLGSFFKFNSNRSFNKSFLKNCFFLIDTSSLAVAKIPWDHQKHLKYYLSYCGLTDILKQRALRIFQNSQRNILTSYCSYLMARPYHESILRRDMN